MSRRILWLLVVATTLTACSDVSAPGSTSPTASASAEASSPSAPPSADATSLLPLGSYVADVPEGVEAAPGEWSMTIDEDGITVVNPESGSTFSPGDIVEVTSDSVVFAADPGCPDQAGEATTGTYGWVLEGTELRFTLEADSCAGRRDTLSSAPWRIAE